MCSWCAQAHVSIHSCDFTNGYFQGQEIDRILLYRIPGEGIPEEGIAGGEIFNQILPTLFTLRDDESKITAVMSSNVDDLLYGYLPEGAEAMNSVLQRFLVGKEEHGTFRFCGKEFRQDEYFGIHVTTTDNTARFQPITYDAKHGLTRKATADEIHQLRSVSLSPGPQGKHDLISLTISHRFKARLKMLVFETSANAIVLSSMQHLHPHVASNFLQIVLGGRCSRHGDQ